MSLLEGHPPVLLGEGVELFSIEVPDALAGRLLRDSEIGSRTGMSVVALEHEGRLITELVADTVLPKGGELLMLGSLEQRRSFAAEFDEQH
jgi:K+/H+ antiporter YhaU regulatory subunit KhtT